MTHSILPSKVSNNLSSGVEEVALELFTLRVGDRVDERVQPAELLADRGEGVLDLLLLRDVAGEADRTLALLAELLHGALEALTRVGEGETHPGVGECT